MKACIILLATVALCAAQQGQKPALSILQTQAEAGDSQAQYELAFRHLDGEEAPRDYRKAAQWFKRAALQGNAQAQLELGVMFVNGEGMPPDRREGYAWYWLASQQSNSQASEYLKDLEQDMPTVQIRLAKKRAEELAQQIKPETRQPAQHRHAARPEAPSRTERADKPALVEEKREASAAGRPPELPGTMHLGVLSVHDPMVDNDEAFSLLAPQGWQREGGIVWRQDLSTLASANMRLFDSQSGAALQLFPLMPYTWAEGGIAFFPEGKIYLGNEVRPPVASASEYVARYVAPVFRGGSRVRVVNKIPLPEVAQAAAQASQEAGMNKRVSAERVRLEYEENGQAMEEEVFCVIVYATGDILPGTTFWGPQRLYSFRAPRGQLDARLPLFQTMVSSVKVNPIWHGKYMEVVELWRKGQLQAIRNAGNLSRYIARTSEEIRQIYREAYDNQQASSDRINANFSKAIRGVEAYQDPVAERRVELPSGYDDAWVSGTGEYILSNQAGFDPNVGSSVTWRRMRTAQ